MGIEKTIVINLAIKHSNATLVDELETQLAASSAITKPTSLN